MPHIVINLWPGRTKEQKRAVCIPVGKALSDAAGIDLEHISVSIHEVKPDEWDATMRNGELVKNKEDIVIPEYTKVEDWV